MQTQEQVFNVYYASMTDAELLANAKNRKFFIPAAQKAMDRELFRRHLTPTDDFRVETSPLG